MRVFFFPVFYDVLILFTSDFFIVVSALEEVGPWKNGFFFFFFWMTFIMVPVGFEPDLSFSPILICQRNVKIREHSFPF